MKLPLAIATLFLSATAVLPAFSATPGPISVSLRDAAATPIEAVQYRQTTRQRQTRTYRNNYRTGRRAYGAQTFYGREPYPERTYPNAWSGSWGQCVGGLSSSAGSAFPSWDRCSGR
jgi:hypothetical protein